MGCFYEIYLEKILIIAIYPVLDSPHQNRNMENKPGQKAKHQDYNNVLKEEFDSIFVPFFGYFMGLPLDAKVRPLPETKVHRTLARDPDFVKLLMGKTGRDVAILHIEMHVKDEKKLLHRCCEFDAMKVREFDLPIHTVIFYVGTKRLRYIKPLLERGGITYKMQVVDVHDMPLEPLLEAAHPAAVLWAILADFGGRKPGEVIRTILERLQNLIKTPDEWAKYSTQLEILSNLRNLQPETLKVLKAMPISDIYDVKKDLRYLEGDENGFERGIEQGIEQGISMKNRETVENLIHGTDFDDEKIANLSNVEVGFVSAIREEIRQKAPRKNSRKS